MVKLGNKLPAAELLVALSVMFATAGQLGIKLGLRHDASLWARVPFALPVSLSFGLLCGLFVYGMGTLLWVLAVSRREISYLYPLASANYILVALSGHILLNERLLTGRWVGIGIMIAGIVLLTYSPPKPAEVLCS